MRGGSCTLARHAKRTAAGATLTYTATATSNAGAKATASVTVDILRIGFAGLRPRTGAYHLIPGRTYTLEVLSDSEPRYVDAATAPLAPAGTHAWFAPAGSVDGTRLWELAIAVQPILDRYPEWDLGVIIGGRTRTLMITTRGVDHLP